MSIDDQMQSMQKSINKIAESVVYNNEMLKHKNVIIQEVKNISVVDNNDYKGIFSALLHDKDKEKYKDLFRFAFMLEKKDYVKFADPAKLQTITDEELKNNYYIETSAFFCNTNSFQMFSNSKGSAVLEQCYTKELFLNSTTSFLSIPSNDIYKSVKDACANCSGCDEAFALCPYKLCALIKLISKNWNKDPMVFYKRFLENEVNVLFPESKPIRFSKDAQILQEIEGIDSKSALSAYILCQLGLFNSEEITENKATFTFLKLCQGHQPKQKLGEVLNFWKTKQGYYGSIIPSQKETVTNTKDNCRSCSYLQCPHRVAAYASYLGKKYNVDVLDLLKYIAENNTAGNLDGRENFQYDKYISNINSLPITTESKKEYVEIIKYILNSRANVKIPKKSFNIVLHTNDEKIADAVFADFSNAIWFFNYIAQGGKFDTAVINVADSNFDELIEKYETLPDGTVFHIKKIELLENTDDITFTSKLQKWMNLLEKRKDKITTFVSGDKFKLQSFFNKSPKLYNLILSHHLFVGDLNEETVCDKIYEKLNESFKLEDNFDDALWNCIAYHYQNSELKSNEYVENFCDNVIFNHYSKSFDATDELNIIDLPEIQKKRSEAEIFAEINSMIGLESIKEELMKINNLMKFNQKMKYGRNVSNMHMVFSGSAGTGKTTVAKLLAEILYTIGAIRQNKIIVCSGKDLIGQYVGQSAPKVAKMCEQAYNGILFIDEAYQLNPYTSNNSDSFKEDAIAELIQQMENNRDRLVVIFAGYSKEMNEFIEKSNSGMKSRIGTVIEFPDYTKDELLQIFTLIANKDNLIVEDDALERIGQVIENEMKNSGNFGNARFVRQLFERTVLNHAFRVKDVEEGSNELSIITKADVDVTVKG